MSERGDEIARKSIGRGYMSRGSVLRPTRFNLIYSMQHVHVTYTLHSQSLWRLNQPTIHYWVVENSRKKDLKVDHA
jgi:hypothetical protein